MASGKKSFLIYCDTIHTVEKLPDEKAGQLLKHILRYVNDQNPETDDLIIQLAFEPIKQQLKRDLKKYEGICERNKINGLKGGRHKNPTEPKKPSGFIDNPNEPKKPDTDTDTDIDIDKEKKDIVVTKKVPTATNLELLEIRRSEFKKSLFRYVEKYGNEMVKKFFEYWSEANKSHTKMKWELQKTWETDRRLATWASRDNSFKRPEIKPCMEKTEHTLPQMP